MNFIFLPLIFFTKDHHFLSFIGTKDYDTLSFFHWNITMLLILIIISESEFVSIEKYICFCMYAFFLFSFWETCMYAFYFYFYFLSMTQDFELLLKLGLSKKPPKPTHLLPPTEPNPPPTEPTAPAVCDEFHSPKSKINGSEIGSPSLKSKKLDPTNPSFFQKKRCRSEVFWDFLGKI